MTEAPGNYLETILKKIMGAFQLAKAEGKAALTFSTTCAGCGKEEAVYGLEVVSEQDKPAGTLAWQCRKQKKGYSFYGSRDQILDSLEKLYERQHQKQGFFTRLFDKFFGKK